MAEGAVPALIIAFEGIHEDVRLWQKTWAPQVHGETDSAPVALIDNPVLLEGLTMVSNDATRRFGLAGDYEKATVIQMLQELHKAGELTASAEDVQAWAMREGWQLGPAKELREAMEGVREGRSFRFRAGRVLKRNIIEVVRERAQSVTSEDSDDPE